ncbi:hypothetical protein UFOVP730_55 [uncultured Caudovirales phage]|uniref:Uncharacterized protein n=1 Tax=uncultured Caudovirales phage TaxID=2100421 RepID=A0A6J5NRU3_9CAUD|nr:hypothetical protein UFOVP730_55 [uncultured Caudovirales phage]
MSDAPMTAEEKEAAALKAAANDPALRAGEKAAATLNQATKKNLDAWLKIGEAMVALAKIAGGNTKLQGKLVAPYPEFASIPSPIRSNAKWLHENLATVEKYRAEGYTYRPKNAEADVTLQIKGDHPTSIREQFRAIEAAINEGSNKGPRPGESEAEYEARLKEEEKAKAQEEMDIQAFRSAVFAFCDNATPDMFRKLIVDIMTPDEGKASHRKAMLKLIEKAKA